MASDQEIQKELDVHIRRLEQELYELKQRRNTLSPISRLPPEIFCKIFLLSIPELDFRDKSGRKLPPATPLSHVSHTWRDIAIGCSELWGILRVGVRTRGDMLNVVAARAEQAPIIINMCGFERGGTPSVPSEETISTLSRIIREGTARCSEVELYAREDSLQSLLSGFSASFDSLATLKLDIAGQDHSYADLKELYQCSFPKLRRLEVDRPAIPLDCKLLQSPHLTHIDILRVLPKATTMTDLLHLFKRSTGLQYLHLGSFAGSSSAYPTSVEIPKGDTLTHMSSLETFTFRLTPVGDTLIHLLSTLSLPSLARLDVYCSSVDTMLLMSSIGSVYGHVAPMALQVQGEHLTACDNSSLDADTPWIHVNKYGGCMTKIWEWGWSFSNLRVMKIGHILSRNAGDIQRQTTAAKFWTFLAETATALEALHIIDQCVSDAAIDSFMECLRGPTRGESNPAVSWPVLGSLHTPLPTGWKYEYKRKREDAISPSLHHQLEYALDLVDALKAREIKGSRFGVQPLTSLEFTSPFNEPVENDTLLILYSAAATVKGRFYPRKTRP